MASTSRFFNVRLRLAGFCLVLVALAGCETQPLVPLFDGWAYEDLLALDPADAPQPSQDLIALYHRIQGNNLEIRLDFLDLEATNAQDLYIFFDTGELSTPGLSGDVQADLLQDLVLVFPADGGARALGPDMQPREDLIPRIVRHANLDAAVVSLNLGVVPELRQDFRLMATVSSSGSTQPLDGLGPIHSTASPPPPAPLLLAFWNSLPAYTPAQALRRWQGAHTGPFGGRHGLETLIAAVETYQIPLTLLDLKNPASLSALDYLGQTERIQNLANDGQLDLPESIPISHQAGAGQLAFLPDEAAIQMGARLSREVARDFDLPSSQALYAPLLPIEVPTRYGLTILPHHADIPVGEGSETATPPYLSRLFRQDGRNYLILPAVDEDLQAHADGLGLPARMALVEAAHSNDSWARGGSTLAILGGDLPLSSWGDPELGGATFHYISAHPWMDVLGLDELIDGARRQAAVPEAPLDLWTRPSLPDPVPFNASGEPQASGLSVTQMQGLILELLNSSSGELQSLGWDAYLALLAPSPPEPADLPALRQGYLGGVAALLAASEWAENPEERNDCSSDLDLDGEPDCVLASEDLFLLIDPEGARVTHAFFISGDDLIQWIAPYSQFINGLSDPAEWQLDRGPAADPGDVPGGFSDVDHRWDPYTVSSLTGRLVFVSQVDGRQKIYELSPSGLTVRYELEDGASIKTQIPILLAPESRFLPGWNERYQSTISSDSFIWQMEGGPQLRLETTGDLLAYPFFSDENQIVFPEDPNYDYPPGHLIPFPIALVEVEGAGEFEIKVSISR